MVEKYPYLKNIFAEASQYNNKSFSNRYMNWKRTNSIIKSFKRCLDGLGNHSGKIRVLEAGCGDGWLVFRLNSEFSQKYNLQFIGLDISDFNIDFANQRKAIFGHKNCNFFIMDLNNFALKDGEFDILISSEVIEHMKEPAKTANYFFQALRKNGLAIITTPNLGSNLVVNFLKFLKSIFTKNNPERLRNDSEHVSAGNLKNWKKIFRDNGFKLLRVEGSGGILCGDSKLDGHRIVFGLLLIIDTLLERLPFSQYWSEILLMEMKK